jgi:hypothetical protein
MTKVYCIKDYHIGNGYGVVMYYANKGDWYWVVESYVRQSTLVRVRVLSKNPPDKIHLNKIGDKFEISPESFKNHFMPLDKMRDNIIDTLI